MIRARIEALVRELEDWPTTGSSYDHGRADAASTIADRLTQLLAEEEGGWRSMDSAPRDGTFVLLWVPADERSDGYCEVGSWVRSAGYWDIGTAQQPDSMFSHWHPEPPPPGARP